MGISRLVELHKAEAAVGERVELVAECPVKLAVVRPCAPYATFRAEGLAGEDAGTTDDGGNGVADAVSADAVLCQNSSRGAAAGEQIEDEMLGAQVAVGPTATCTTPGEAAYAVRGRQPLYLLPSRSYAFLRFALETGRPPEPLPFREGAAEGRG
jgi:hypothetical protein